MLEFLFAQADPSSAAKFGMTFWDVVHENMGSIIAGATAIGTATLAGIAGAGRVIYLWVNSYVEQRSKALAAKADAEIAKSERECSLLLTMEEHVPKQTKAMEDTCRVLAALQNEHVETKLAVAPVIDAAITIIEKSKFDLPSDAIKDLKRDLREGRNRMRIRRGELRRQQEEREDSQINPENERG